MFYPVHHLLHLVHHLKWWLDLLPCPRTEIVDVPLASPWPKAQNVNFYVPLPSPSPRKQIVRVPAAPLAPENKVSLPPSPLNWFVCLFQTVVQERKLFMCLQQPHAPEHKLFMCLWYSLDPEHNACIHVPVAAPYSRTQTLNLRVPLASPSPTTQIVHVQVEASYPKEKLFTFRLCACGVPLPKDACDCCSTLPQYTKC